MLPWWGILLIVIGAVIVILTAIWLIMCRVQFGRRLYPGDNYVVGGVTYTVPKDLEMHGAAYLLNEDVLLKIRDLTQRTSDLCKELGKEVWVTYGTLLGLERHQTLPIPWDDDSDLATSAENREFFFSTTFGNAAKNAGLEAFKLTGSSAVRATKEGSAVRLRLKGTKFPTLDIFFHKVTSDRVSLLKSWSGGNDNIDEKRSMAADIVFPLQEREIDGLTLNFPANPRQYLTVYYGDDVFKKAYPRPLEFSHYTAFIALDAVWVPL